jgi:diguanylate cyclase (GGDEF)-like protein/PAS domain S-box-containing protein
VRINRAARVLAYAVGPLALVILLVLRTFHVVADAPVWGYVAAIAGSIGMSRLVERWTNTRPGEVGLHARVGGRRDGNRRRGARKLEPSRGRRLGVNRGRGRVDVGGVTEDAGVAWSAAGGPEDLATALPDPVVLIGSFGELRWANRAAERLFGLTLADAAGRNILDYLHPDDAQVATLAVTSVQEKEVGTLLELRVRAGDGWRLVEVRGTSFGDDILLTVRDITDRRRWEVAGDEVARFRALIQNGASITMLLDGDGTIDASSVVVTRLLGHDQELIEGRALAGIVDERDRATFMAALRAVRAPESGPVTVDLRLRHVDGGAVPFALTFTNLLDDPTLGGIVATGHDISDRVTAEADLRETNSLLATTLESTADGILVVDQDGQISSFNRRFAEMWRIPDDVLESRHDGRALAWVVGQLRDPETFLTKVQELYATPDAHSHDVLQFKDGRVFERDSLPRKIGDDVVGRVWSFRDITEQEQLKQELAYQALHDSLTGLANQALFRDRVDHASARLHRKNHQLAVLFIDLDDFKNVNDTLGHWAGDALLVQISERLVNQLRAEDTAARLGGDEFAVLVDDLTDRNHALEIAQRIIDVLQEPIIIASKELSITASVGIAYGEKGTNADELLRNADLAMYAAKAQGKNCRRVFEPDMHASAVDRLDLEAHIRVAIRRREFALHFQPIYELQSGRIPVVEALARWNHPERGVLSPDAFISFAEQNGLIDDLGDLLLEMACEEAGRWATALGPDAPAIAVNLSPRQLHNHGLCDRISSLVQGNGLRTHALILEITEGALMTDPERAGATLHQLHRMGVRLAVDDFGTGYSSLSYLQRFPIEILKIDRTFVNDMLTKPEKSLAHAIIHLAHTLGLTPIAEGVEHQTQVDALREYGCDLAQGFHLARPLVGLETIELLRANLAARATAPARS